MKPSADACWRELGRGAGPFPWEAMVLDEASSESELGVRGDDEPCPTVGLFGCADRWCGPAKGALGEAEGVLDVEASEVGAPAQIEVGLVWS